MKPQPLSTFTSALLSWEQLGSHSTRKLWQQNLEISGDGWSSYKTVSTETRDFVCSLLLSSLPHYSGSFTSLFKKKNKTIKALDHELLSTITGPDKRIEQKNHRRFERPPGRASMEFICHKFSKPFRNGFQVARCPKPQKWMLYLVRPREKWMTGVTPSRKPPPGPAACG